MGERIRLYDPAPVSDSVSGSVLESDRQAVLSICVLTGDAGRDATGLGDPRELTERYAAPYLDLEREHAWVAEREGRVLGYLLAAADTASFAARFEARPSPLLNADARGRHAADMLRSADEEYPAHLHVDLLPEGQGSGFGRRLVEHCLEQLAAEGVPGVHLVVDPRNEGAQAFYARVGFTERRRDADGIVFGRLLS
ncbi:GNAT family N-acetyltransferase [Herbiconiux sp.]|uniref:GNAT family N-acetyltransferase n=1 Tax=Herbiconiux sp. TaxID=1871186 RepID=UPI0025C45D50|nr:GNAT family N-acetyltransferase [Herbiconiux sp.]